MKEFIYFFESMSIWIGRAFGWCILFLPLSVTYEVFVRYVLYAPTVWAVDMMVQVGCSKALGVDGKLWFEPTLNYDMAGDGSLGLGAGFRLAF